MSTYKCESFYLQSFAGPLGAELWSFLNRERTIGKMIAASFHGGPSVEPIAQEIIDLARAANEEPELSDTCKRMIGHMVKQIMEEQGFSIRSDEQNISDPILFRKGATYAPSSQKE